MESIVLVHYFGKYGHPKWDYTKIMPKTACLGSPERVNQSENSRRALYNSNAVDLTWANDNNCSGTQSHFFVLFLILCEQHYTLKVG